MAETEEDLTNCSVCYENYEESGDHVPMLLPCIHTLCEKCLNVSIRNSKLDCPECRVNHDVGNGPRGFPQNKYILAYIRKQSSMAKDSKYESEESFGKCGDHGREMRMYCNEQDCKKQICPLCLARHHKNHKYVDLELQNEKIKPLMDRLEFLQQSLQENRKKLLVRRDSVVAENSACSTTLQSKKKELIKAIIEKYDGLVAEASEHNKKIIQNIDDKLASTDENIVLLCSIKENTKQPSITDEEITSSLDTVKSMGHQLTSNTAAAEGLSMPFRYSFMVDTSQVVESLCGKLVDKPKEEPREREIDRARPSLQ